MFEKQDREIVAAAMDAAVPGSAALGAVDYVEGLLHALDHDPPRIWAAPGPWAGEGSAAESAWLQLGPWERHAWAQRIASWRGVYERLLAGTAEAGDRDVIHAHACEASYGDPAYGGNRDGGGWVRIGFPEPLFPPTRGRA